MTSHVKRTVGRAIALAALALGLALLLPTAAQAVPVGYWQFEGTPGGAVGVVPNAISPGTLNGAGEGGATYSSNVVGTTIWDPISNTTHANGTSLSSAGPALVRVLDNPALDAADFTMETFIRTPDQTSYPAYVSHILINSQGWQLDVDPSEQARARFDVTPSSVINQVVGSAANQAIGDDRWHHTAVTFNSATKLITLYTDYGLTATRTLTGTASEATNIAADLLLGGTGGWPAGTYIDEARYSSSVLTSGQFLRSVNNALWRMEGTPGAAIGAVPNAFNPGTLDGAGESGKLYSSDVPKNSVFDPITGTTWSNTSSLNLSSPGSVRVLDNDELDSTPFTVEAFVKIGGDQGGYPGIIARLVTNTSGWQLDIDPDEDARARFDTGSLNNQVVGSNPPQSLADFDWHHVALTFDGATARLYVDYANLATRNITGPKFNINSVLTDLLLGSSVLPAGSALDEVRYSASPLSPDQFLRAVQVVPEPATMTLLGLAGFALLRRRRAA